MQSAPMALESVPQSLRQRQRGARFPGRRNRAAALVGLVAFAISAAVSWIPSYWFDEVATVMASRLSWGELFTFTAHIDVVHLTYYSLMKLWLGALGESELATRSFSALAIAAAAAGLVVLVNALTNLHVGVISGAIFAILPHTTFIGVEARSYALSAAIAIWSTVALLLSLRGTRRRWWLVYAVTMTVGVYVFLYSILLLLAHGVYLVRHHRVRRLLLPWLCAAAAVALAALPLIRAGLEQKGQIAWIAYEPTRDLWALLTEPAFQQSRDVAALACVAAVLLGLCFARRLSVGRCRLLGLALAWFFIPLLTLLMADAAVGSVFTPRYLSFAVPAVAVLLAIAFTLTPLRPVAWLLVLGLALACLPGYLAQRTPLAKNHGSDLAQIADHIRENALPGDGIFLDDPDFGNTQPRLALSGYPAAFANTTDVAFTRSFSTTGGFSDITRDLEWIGDGLDGIDRLWVVTAGGPGSPEVRNAHLILGAKGFVDVSGSETNLSTIVLFER